jgi:hypothetical protein
MAEEDQFDLLSPIKEPGLVGILLADLHDDLPGKIARFRQLTHFDRSQVLAPDKNSMDANEIAAFGNVSRYAGSRFPS